MKLKYGDGLKVSYGQHRPGIGKFVKSLLKNPIAMIWRRVWAGAYREYGRFVTEFNIGTSGSSLRARDAMEIIFAGVPPPWDASQTIDELWSPFPGAWDC